MEFSSLQVVVLPSHVSLLFPVFLVSGFFFLHGVGGLCRHLSLVPEGVQPRLFRDETLRAGAAVVLRTCRSSLLVATPAAGFTAPGMVEPLSLLFSAVVSFSFEALAVSEEAGCVLEELPWDDLFSVSELTSLSASC